MVSIYCKPSRSMPPPDSRRSARPCPRLWGRPPTCQPWLQPARSVEAFRFASALPVSCHNGPKDNISLFAETLIPPVRAGSATASLVVLFFAVLLALLLALLHDVPVVHSGCCDLHGLAGCEYRQPPGSEVAEQDLLTVICSLRNSASSSQSTRLFLALPNLSTSSVSASSIGYASMTFAPSQMYTSSVGGTSALANSVSLSSKVVSIGSVSSWYCCQPPCVLAWA